MQRAVLLAFFLTFFIPFSASAAGFAQGSLFLSKSAPVEGEVVLIHAVVSNESTAFSGELVFLDGTEKIDAVPLKLAVGEAQAVSVSWKPAAGKHDVVAELHMAGDVVERQSATFAIAPKLEPTASSTPSGIESSEHIQNSIAGLSPAAASAVSPLFTLIDRGRESAAGVLDSQLTSTKQKLGANTGNVLGSESPRGAAEDPLGTLWYILNTLYLYLLTILRFIVGAAGVFYPALAALVLFLLWKTFRRFRRA